MRIKSVFLAAILTAVLCISGNLSAATYGGGIGTPTDPYLISTPDQLNQIGANPADWGMCFKVTADIDLSAYSGTSFNLIGASSTPFYGTFDGNDHVIRNFSYSTTASSGYAVGLFAYTTLATIKNLGLVNFNISSTGNEVAPLVGDMSYGTIDNCCSVATITGGDNSIYLGGLVGDLRYGTITNSRCTGSVTGGANSRYLGGLVGYQESGAINNSSSACSVTGSGLSRYLGGLVGRQENTATIDGCFSAGTVTGGYELGGIVGYCRNTVSNCYSISAVNVATNGLHGGGLAGYVEGATFTNCYTTGPVTGADGSKYLGGLVGWQITGNINNCRSDSSVTGGANSQNLGGLVGNQSSVTTSQSYSTGPVTGGTNCMFIGGLAGWQDAGTISNCYSTSAVAGGTGGWDVGGLIGYIAGGVSATTDKSFSTGAVSSGGGTNIGGMVGYKETGAAVNACFWDINTSGMSTSAAGKGKTTAVMKTQDTFVSAGWDFVSIWQMNGYPCLAWQPAIGTSGNFSTDLSRNQQGQIVFNIFSITGESFNWTITGYASSTWVTNISPLSGSSSGASITPVTVTLDTAGLLTVDYVCILTISADNNDTILVPLKVHVFDRINFENFAQLADWWQTTACVSGQPCKAVDWYVDGIIDIKDLELLAQGWLSDEVQKFAPVIEDFFETGDFTHLNWQQSGNLGWVIVSSSPYQGTYSAKSGPITDSQTSTLQFTVDTTGWEIDTIGFACKVSSESGYDYLRFYIDGVELTRWSGEVPWTLQTYTITPGLHTFKWSYTKDSDGSSGSDCGWIDSVRIFKK